MQRSKLGTGVDVAVGSREGDKRNSPRRPRHHLLHHLKLSRANSYPPRKPVDFRP